LKQKEYSQSISMVKPNLGSMYGVDGTRMFNTLDLWRVANAGNTASANSRLNKLLKRKYLPIDYQVSTHLLRTMYANGTFEIIVKPNVWQLGVCTVNRFLSDALGHHSLEMGLAYLHLVVVDDRYEQLQLTLSSIQSSIHKAYYQMATLPIA